MQQLNGTSKDIVSENIEKLKELFPEVFSEGKIDFKKLEIELGSFTCNEPERYNFTWAGVCAIFLASLLPAHVKL